MVFTQMYPCAFFVAATPSVSLPLYSLGSRFKSPLHRPFSTSRYPVAKISLLAAPLQLHSLTARISVRRVFTQLLPSTPLLSLLWPCLWVPVYNPHSLLNWHWQFWPVAPYSRPISPFVGGIYRLPYYLASQGPILFVVGMGGVHLPS